MLHKQFSIVVEFTCSKLQGQKLNKWRLRWETCGNLYVGTLARWPIFGQPPEKMADIWDSLHGVKWDFFSWGTLWWDWGLPFPYFFFGQLKTRSSNWPKSMFWIRSDGTMHLLRIRRVYRFLWKSHIHTDDPKLCRAQLFSMKTLQAVFCCLPPSPGNLGIDTKNGTFGKGDSFELWWYWVHLGKLA